MRSVDAFTPDAAFDVAPDWIALVDLDHVIRRVNKTMADALGVTPGELVGRTCHQVVHGSDEPVTTCPHMRLLAGSGESCRDIAEIPGQGVFEVLCAPLRDQAGALAGTVHMMSDISRRVHVGMQAEEHAHYLQQVLDAVPTPIFHKDAQGRYVVVNTTFAQMAGLSRDEIVGKSAADIFPGEIADDIHEYDRALLAQGGSRIPNRAELVRGPRPALRGAAPLRVRRYRRPAGRHRRRGVRRHGRRGDARGAADTRGAAARPVRRHAERLRGVRGAG